MRWRRFNAIGTAGAVVQLGALNVLLACGLHYLLATALAVETAILHNCCWHMRWPWKDPIAASLLNYVLCCRFVFRAGVSGA